MSRLKTSKKVIKKGKKVKLYAGFKKRATAIARSIFGQPKKKKK